MLVERTSPEKKAKELGKYLRRERPDYDYLKSVFRHLRGQLEVSCTQKKLPYVPTENELKRIMKKCGTRRTFEICFIKTWLYTGVCVSELINIKQIDVDFQQCQIRVNQGKGKKDRIVPFPFSFKETLAMHTESMRKKKYTDREIWKILKKYPKKYTVHN